MHSFRNRLDFGEVVGGKYCDGAFVIVEGISPLQQSPLSFAVIIDCSGLRSSRYEMKTW